MLGVVAVAIFAEAFAAKVVVFASLAVEEVSLGKLYISS